MPSPAVVSHFLNSPLRWLPEALYNSIGWWYSPLTSTGWWYDPLGSVGWWYTPIPSEGQYTRD